MRNLKAALLGLALSFALIPLASASVKAPAVNSSGGGGGTVSSVSLSMPSGFTVSGSPCTTACAFAVTTTLSGVLKGTGSAFTTALSADIIALFTGTCSSTTFLRGDGACAAETGTVSSVALSTPSWLTVGGSPITTSGTLAITATTGLTANQALMTPNGSAGALAPRALVGADLNAAMTASPGFTSILMAPAAGTATPCYSFFGFTNWGICYNTSNSRLEFVGAGTAMMELTSTLAVFNNNVHFNNALKSSALMFDSATVGGTVTGCGTPTYLRQDATAVTFTVGTGATPCTFVFTMGTSISAPPTYGYTCIAYDVSTGISLPPTVLNSTSSCTVKGIATTGDTVTIIAFGT